MFPIAEEQSRFLCIAYQNLTGEGVSGKRFRLQNLLQIFVCSPGKIPLEFFKITGIMDIQLGRRETDTGHHKRTVSQTEKLGERKETPESGGDGLHLFTGAAGTAGESGPERPGVDDCG